MLIMILILELISLSLGKDIQRNLFHISFILKKKHFKSNLNQKQVMSRKHWKIRGTEFELELT